MASVGWMDCPPVSPGGGSELPEALLEPGVGAGLTGSPWWRYLKDFEHYLASMWNELNCALVWIFFSIVILWDWMKTDLFQSCGHCWVFQFCWHIECSTFTASSFRIVIVYYNVTIFNICSVSLLWFSPLVSCHLYVGILGLSSVSISFKSLWFFS